MKISNETKVGILSIAALTLLILGFNFLKGKELFTKNDKIYAVFTDLGSLSVSNEVKINGYVIGKVYKLEAKDKNLTGIVATINLAENVNIPVNSRAFISSPIVGSSFIAIQRGNSTDYLKPGDTLSTGTEAGFIDNVKAELNPTLTKVKEGIDSVKMLISNINSLFTPNTKAHLQHTLQNLDMASNSLNRMLDTESGPLARTLKNVSSVTDNLRNNNDSITATINNAKRASEKFAAIDLQPTIDSLNTMIVQLKATVSKISSTEGSLGALIHDRALYDKLNDAILSAEILLDDLRENPKRYVNFSIFGRKDKDGPLTSPTRKDTTAVDRNR